jgi:alpha-1,2-glucosyltransferase
VYVQRLLQKRDMARPENSAVLWLATAGYVAVTAAVFRLMNAQVPEPYMDEIFHVPQAKKYCNGKFTEARRQLITGSCRKC